MINKLKWWVPFLLVGVGGSASVSAAKQPTGYIGLLQEDINQSGVFELGIRAPVNRFVDSSAAFSWFGNNDIVYEGLNLGLNLTTGTYPIKAYAGAGVFIGEHKECDEVDTSDCDTDYTAAVYPEVGVELTFFRLKVATYGRYYKTSSGGKNEYKMYGAYIGYTF